MIQFISEYRVQVVNSIAALQFYILCVRIDSNA